MTSVAMSRVLPLAERALRAMQDDVEMEITPDDYNVLIDAVSNRHSFHTEVAAPGDIARMYLQGDSTWDNALRTVCYREGWPVPSFTSVKIKVTS